VDPVPHLLLLRKYGSIIRGMKDTKPYVGVAVKIRALISLAVDGGESSHFTFQLLQPVKYSFVHITSCTHWISLRTNMKAVERRKLLVAAGI
jgi:hypothetical protein